MRRYISIICIIALAGQLLPGPALAEDPAPITDTTAAIDRARDLIYNQFDYDAAIAELEPAVENPGEDVEQLRTAYLLLIESYVLRGNDQSDDLGRTLHHDKAQEWVARCLSIPELRHTRPDSTAASETVAYFREARNRMFGTLFIGDIEPPDATVMFLGEPLLPNEQGVWRAEDVPVGAHALTITHPKYKDIEEDIDIEPGQVFSKDYALDANRGAGWYLTRGAVAVVAGALIAWAWIGSGGNDEPSPLPAPPAAPSNP